MKKSVMVVLALALAACSPNEQAQQQSDAAEAFAKAQKHVENATSGYIADGGFEGTHASYVSQELSSAATALKAVSAQGSPAQQAATARLLAEVQASMALSSAQQGAAAWSTQASLATDLLRVLAKARDAQSIATANTNADSQQLLSDLSTQRQGARELASQIQADVNDLQKKIDGLRSQQDAFGKQVAAHAAKSQQLKQAADAASGQKAFDTFRKAAAESRLAAQASAKADELGAQLSVLEPAIAALHANLAMANERAAKLGEAISGVTSHDTARTAVAADARKKADAAAGELDQAMGSLAEKFTNDVMQQFIAAMNGMTNAITTLEAAQAKDADQAEALKLALASRKFELAQVTGQYADILRAYRDVVKVLAEQSSTGFPTQTVGLIQEAATLAEGKAADIGSEAAKAWGQARTVLQELAEQASTQEVKDAAATMLASVNQRLAAAAEIDGNSDI